MTNQAPMDEARARALAEEAVERAGGTRHVYRNPRHPFALQPSTTYEIDGERVELRHGEISSPAIVTVAGYVFEIHENEIELLIRPPKPRA
ncbi:MAG TPA: protein-L-isoaspartate o-methyltransferase 1 [Thermomicrobiales bacterium]